MRAQKRAVILLNGEPYGGEIPCENAYVICCDGAYAWAKGRVKINENLGDFDSLAETPVPPPRMKFPAEKNETDGELALDRALALGAAELFFYGGEGKRNDHFLGNLHLLLKAVKGGATRAVLVGKNTLYFACGKGEQRVPCKGGQTVSLLPFGGDAHIMKMRGLKYAAEDLRLRYGSTRGISNQTEGEEFSFRVKKGYVLVIINGEET